MRIVITGGAGFIGRSLAADLTAAGYEVAILSRNPAKAAGLPAGANTSKPPAVAVVARTVSTVVSIGGGNMAPAAG